MAAVGRDWERDIRAEYLWFMEHGFRWPKNPEERDELYPLNEYDMRKRGEELSEENRAEARYADARREALWEMARPEWERFNTEYDARLDAAEAGQ